MLFGHQYLLQNLAELTRNTALNSKYSAPTKNLKDMPKFVSYANFLERKQGVKSLVDLFSNPIFKDIYSTMVQDLSKEKFFLEKGWIYKEIGTQDEARLKKVERYSEYLNISKFSLTIENVLTIASLLFGGLRVRKDAQNFTFEFNHEGEKKLDIMYFFSYVEALFHKKGLEVVVTNLNMEDIRKNLYLVFEEYYIGEQKMPPREFNCLVFGFQSYPACTIVRPNNRVSEFEAYCLDKLVGVMPPDYEISELAVYGQPLIYITTRVEDLGKKDSVERGPSELIDMYEQLMVVDQRKNLLFFKQYATSLDRLSKMHGLVEATLFDALKSRRISVVSDVKKKNKLAKLLDEMLKAKYIVLYVHKENAYYYVKTVDGMHYRNLKEIKRMAQLLSGLEYQVKVISHLKQNTSDLEQNLLEMIEIYSNSMCDSLNPYVQLKDMMLMLLRMWKNVYFGPSNSDVEEIECYDEELLEVEKLDYDDIENIDVIEEFYDADGENDDPGEIGSV